jgi:hypothetical protein
MKSDDVRCWSLLSASVAGPPSCSGGLLEISGSKCSHFETSAIAYCYVRASLSVAQLSAARDVCKLILFYIAVQCANRDAALERLPGWKLHVSDATLSGRSVSPSVFYRRGYERQGVGQLRVRQMSDAGADQAARERG